MKKLFFALAFSLAATVSFAQTSTAETQTTATPAKIVKTEKKACCAKSDAKTCTAEQKAACAKKAEGKTCSKTAEAKTCSKSAEGAKSCHKGTEKAMAMNCSHKEGEKCSEACHKK